MTFVVVANAQKGTFLVSGSASYYSDRNSDDNAIDNQNFGFTPKFGSTNAISSGVFESSSRYSLGALFMK